MVVWFVVGIMGTIWVTMQIQRRYGSAEAAQLFFDIFLATCGTTPTLGAILFVLALDVARARKEIRGLEASAQDMSLTVIQYDRSRGYIEGIARGTQGNMRTLSGIALLNIAGYLALVLLSMNSKQIDKAAYLTYFAIMGKEGCLFVAFAYLAMIVNDAADDVTTEVFLWPSSSGEEEGEAAAAEEATELLLANRRQRKVEILAQATNFVGPKERRHRGKLWMRFVAFKAGPIGFKVMGVRWTSTNVLALAFSVVASVVGSIAVAVLRAQAKVEAAKAEAS